MLVCVRLTLHQILLRRLDPLANGLRNFLRLAGTVAHHRGRRIAHHHQRRKRKILAALDHLGHAVDGDHLVFQLERTRIKFLNHCWHS